MGLYIYRATDIVSTHKYSYNYLCNEPLSLCEKCAFIKTVADILQFRHTVQTPIKLLLRSLIWVYIVSSDMLSK